jgi:hypothetical protein
MKYRSSSGRIVALLFVIEIAVAGAAHAQTPIGQPGRFPIKISKPGSYRLIGDLQVKGGDGIAVLTDHVSIDLNGFSIIGSNVAASPGENGINATNRSFVSVSHGSVANMSGTGILLGSEGVIREIHADGNGGSGLSCKGDCSISDSTASLNGGDGILVASNSVVSNSITNGNKGVGISSGPNSTATGNTANANSAGGIMGGNIDIPCHCRIVGNTANDNLSFGILAGDFANIAQNVADGNATFGICGGISSSFTGNTAGDNTSEGIIIHAGSVVLGNNVVDNGTAGLTFVTDNGTSGYGQNTMLNNHLADTSGGSSLGQANTNLCSGQKC